MAKKKKLIPEQRLRKPDSISESGMIMAMRRLIENQDFQLLHGRWLTQRGGLLEAGKEKPSEAQWSRLAGFDDASMEAYRWADREPAGNKNRSADELQAALGGNQTEEGN